MIDATRIADSKLVYIKRVATGDEETKIALMFSDEGRSQDPRNHCIPILDVLQDDSDPNVSYIVMPFMRFVDDPPFEFVNDVIEFVDQILEVRLPSLFRASMNTIVAGFGLHA